MRVTIAQLNPIVGALDYNINLIKDAYKKGVQEGSDLVITPESSATGYPLEDLILIPRFLSNVAEKLDELICWVSEQKKDVGLIVGFPILEGGNIYNAVAMIDPIRKRVEYRYKCSLPNYQCFDELRTYTPGALNAVNPWHFKGQSIAIYICEEMWLNAVYQEYCQFHVDFAIAVNGSPFVANKIHTRIKLAEEKSRPPIGGIWRKETRIPFIYVNMVGGNSELVFDGGSFVRYRNGNSVILPFFQSVTETIDTEWVGNSKSVEIPSAETQIYCASVLGLRDYVAKSGYTDRAVLGISGGIDSSLVATIAVDALGSDKVVGLLMPSAYSSEHSVSDGLELGVNLGIKTEIVNIEPAVQAYREMMYPTLGDVSGSLTEQNFQPRVRGNTLLAYSNKYNCLVLNCTNKTEGSLGYGTISGDLVGFAVILDLYKGDIYNLSRWRNEQTELPNWFLGPVGAVIPKGPLTKKPSAELLPGQVDTDDLPADYPVLDAILQVLLEKGHDTVEYNKVVELYGQGLVDKIEVRMFRNEFKRRLTWVGLKMTDCLHTKERRVPIVNRWK